MSSNWVWFWVVVTIGALVATFFVIRRRRYLGELKALGWSHNPEPTLNDVADLNAPPFGLGLRRSVDELISGTTAGGHSFRSFEYDYSGAGPKWSGRVACVQLPFGLPDAFVTDLEHSRVGIAPAGSQLVQADGRELRVIAADSALAGKLLGLIESTAAGFGQVSGQVDLGIDGDQLVATRAPKDPEQLKAYLTALDPIAQALSGTGLRSFERPAAADRFGFYGHPDWHFDGDDTGVLDRYPVTTGGFGHEVTDQVTGGRDGIRLDAFTHEWKTHRTETYTDGQGNVRTRQVTEEHSEPVCGFLLPFGLPGLSVNGRRLGDRVAFESDAFNRAFKVRADDPKFAYDSIHPRTMEWLLASGPRGWTVSGPVVVFEVEAHDLLIVDECEAVLRGWLGRIPRFVWADRGLQPPPYLVE